MTELEAWRALAIQLLTERQAELTDKLNELRDEVERVPLGSTESRPVELTWEY